jgi:serine/threonine-protein kinase RIO1
MPGVEALVVDEQGNPAPRLNDLRLTAEQARVSKRAD